MERRALVFVEHVNGEIPDASWEAIRLGRQLAEQERFEVAAVLLGPGIEPLAERVGEVSGLTAYVVPDPLCDPYTPEVYCDLLAQVIEQESPELVLMGHSYRAAEFGPTLAMRLRTAFLPNCVDCRVDGGRVVVERSILGGKMYQRAASMTRAPSILTLLTGTAGPLHGPGVKAARVVALAIRVRGNLALRRVVLDVVPGLRESTDLAAADIVIGVGRGLGTGENVRVASALAAALGAAVGATRPVVDAGWLPRSQQIGSSGRTVKPKLYIACGVSGAPQHLVGIERATWIVAINTDRHAPIFRIADYGVVANALEVLPALTQAIQEVKRARVDGAITT